MTDTNFQQQADAFIQAAKSFTWRPRQNLVEIPRHEHAFRLPGSLPPNWNLRNKGILSTSKDQRLTNACTSFAIAAATEAAVRVANGQNVLLAPWYVHTCLLDAKPEEGWNIEDVLPKVIEHGIAYTLDSNEPWPKSQCSTSNVLKIKGASIVSNGDSAKQMLVAGHVVICTIQVNWDFFRTWSKDQVYRYRPDANASSHSVCLAGYDDDVGCWLIQNSNGISWGSNGFGMIGYDSCGIFSQFSMNVGMCIIL